MTIVTVPRRVTVGLVITVSSGHACMVACGHVRVGDRVIEGGQRNSIRAFIKRFVSLTEWEVLQVCRPSRGFARHVRRRKAARR